jgi:hypothetical protein
VKRKHILLKNEINNLQKIVKGEIFVADFYKDNLVERLEELKSKWYKVKKFAKLKSLTQLDSSKSQDKLFL